MPEPGWAIQKQGWLIVCDEHARTVRRHSTNLAEAFPARRGPFIGAPLRDLIGSEESHRLRNFLSRFTAPGRPALAAGRFFPGVDRDLDAAVHFNGEEMVLEFEPAADEGRLAAVDRAGALIARLEGAADVADLGRRAAMLACAALDADQAFVLLCNGQGRGNEGVEIVGVYRRLGGAPETPEDLWAFAGEHRMYALADVEAVDSPILSEKGLLRLDDGLTALRAADAPLRAWLRREGLRSAALIPIAADGVRLGLIAALGREPRWPGLGLRSGLDLFGDVLALRLRHVLPPKVQSTPAVQPTLAAAAPDQPDDQPIQVLIVEDQPLIALQLAASLNEAGAKVAGAGASVRQTLDLLETLVFDAALLDFKLGEENVLPIAEILAARGLPFVFASGYGESLQLPPAFANRPVVAKPYQIDKIMAALKAALDKESA